MAYDWTITNIPPINGEMLKQIDIGHQTYITDDSTACLCHCLLLLVCSINKATYEVVDEE